MRPECGSDGGGGHRTQGRWGNSIALGALFDVGNGSGTFNFNGNYALDVLRSGSFETNAFWARHDDDLVTERGEDPSQEAVGLIADL